MYASPDPISSPSKACHARISDSAREIGFDAVGIIPTEPASEEQIKAFEAYLANGRQAGMHYLENHCGKRYDPRLLLPGARSIVVVLYGYAPRPEWPVNRHISLYAQGEDYHKTIKDKLFLLSRSIPSGSFRCFCDTAPILEKYWAAKAGLGFIGRNTLLIHPELGSYCFIGIILCQAEFDRYSPGKDPSDLYPGKGNGKHPCNHCRLCIAACPGKALGNNPEGSLDARQCFSYLTIENKGERPSIPTPYWFGCDICQQVCPANRNAMCSSPGHKEFRATEPILELDAENLFQMENGDFEKLFKDSPLTRTGLEGLRKNILAGEKDAPPPVRSEP